MTTSAGAKPIQLKGLFSTNQLTDLLFVVNDKNRWHRTSASMHDAGHQFPTGCVFKESFPNYTIPTVRQTNNAAS
jgi:hypothetical protein